VKLRIALLPLLCCVLTLPLAAQSFNEDAWGRNSPGVELQAVEGPRAHSTSGTALIYNLVGKGFPANQARNRGRRLPASASTIAESWSAAANPVAAPARDWTIP
jgi:hypothetical protein